MENQLDRKIKQLRTNKGEEYESNSLTTFCNKNGIIHDVSVSCTPQHKRIAECKNRNLKEIINVMLLSLGLSDNMRGKLFYLPIIFLIEYP